MSIGYDKIPKAAQRQRMFLQACGEVDAMLLGWAIQDGVTHARKCAWASLGGQLGLACDGQVLHEDKIQAIRRLAQCDPVLRRELEHPVACAAVLLLLACAATPVLGLCTCCIVASSALGLGGAATAAVLVAPWAIATLMVFLSCMARATDILALALCGADYAALHAARLLWLDQYPSWLPTGNPPPRDGLAKAFRRTFRWRSFDKAAMRVPPITGAGSFLAAQQMLDKHLQARTFLAAAIASDADNGMDYMPVMCCAPVLRAQRLQAVAQAYERGIFSLTAHLGAWDRSLGRARSSTSFLDLSTMVAAFSAQGTSLRQDISRDGSTYITSLCTTCDWDTLVLLRCGEKAMRLLQEARAGSSDGALEMVRSCVRLGMADPTGPGMQPCVARTYAAVLAHDQGTW